MMIYSQKTGEYRTGDGSLLAKGYSGYLQGKNNPELENRKNLGPIPRGFWLLEEIYDSANVGSNAIRLKPLGHDAHGRTDFLIHGDSVSKPGEASRGCIILPKAVRLEIWSGKDRLLQVI